MRSEHSLETPFCSHQFPYAMVGRARCVCRHPPLLKGAANLEQCGCLLCTLTGSGGLNAWWERGGCASLEHN